MPIPILKNTQIELSKTDIKGLSLAKVLDYSGKESLSWDRYVRLQAVAEIIQSQLIDTKELANKNILDVGGYDGSLAFFLPEHNIFILDPETTGTSILNHELKEKSFEIVTCIDAIEHIEPNKRQLALFELAKICKSYLLINYPCAESKKAQELMYQLTKNPLIAEHCHWDLPDSEIIMSYLAKLSFKAKCIPHTSQAVWLGQYFALNTAGELGKLLDNFLTKHHTNMNLLNYKQNNSESYLYHLLFCSAERSK